MVVTRRLLQEFIDISKLESHEIYSKLNSIGLEVDKFFEIRLPKSVIVGEIIECIKHPNADRLSVCKVNVGDSIKTIVCGAKNVVNAKFVAVALEGTILPNGMEIKRSEIRGVSSEGMICSSSELGLVEIEDGIMILDNSIGLLKPGIMLSELLDDDIFEIDITPNRGDCLSIFGVARELSASFGIGLKKIEFIKNDENTLGIGRFFQLSHEGATYSNLLYKVVEFEELKTPFKIAFYLALNSNLKKEPLQNFLSYASYLSGVILNAYKCPIYDESKSKKPTFMVRKDENGLDSLYFTDKLSTICINIQESAKPKEDDKRVILEASFVEPNTISRLAFETKVQKDKDIFYLSSRGSNPDLSFGMSVLCDLFKKHSKATIFSGTHELSGVNIQKTLSISLQKISAIIGQEIDEARLINTLKNLFFEVDGVIDDQNLIIKIPAFRHDISSYQDVIEEIVRIFGIDNITPKPLLFFESRRLSSAYFEYKKISALRERIISNGFFETLHFVFSSRELQESLLLPVVSKELELTNPITAELNTLRSTLLVGLLESASRNIKNGKKNFGLFEIGSVFDKDRNEKKRVAFVYIGSKEEPYFLNHGKPKNMEFFEFCNTIASIIGNFELKDGANLGNLLHPYIKAKMVIETKEIGTIAKLHPNVQKRFELPETLICEVDLDALLFEKKVASEYSKLQIIDRDISVLISKDIPFKAIREAIKMLNIKEIKNIVPLDIYYLDEFKDKISLTIRLYIQPDERSLEDDEINSIIQKCIYLLNSEFSAELR